MVTKQKRTERLKRLERTESEKTCVNCNIPYERRKRKERPANKYFFTEWDYCNRCKRVQHYDQYKCRNWQEEEANYQHFNSIKNER